MNELIITSPQFEPEGWMPDSISGYGEDMSPELHIGATAENAVSLVVAFDDLDHPIQPGYNHWIAWNLPPVAVIPGGLPIGASADKPLHIEQGLAYGKHRYRGPKPPFNWEHRYRFTVYALDCLLPADAAMDKEAVLKASEGHILQSGTLFGKYKRKHGQGL